MSDKPEKKPYHHGNLHEALMEEGLAMIHEEGLAQFSLRKLAKRVGVSPTACYNHFDGIDALIAAMNQYVTERFAEAVEEGIAEMRKHPENMMMAVGQAYVCFFKENPHYFSFVFDNESCNIRIQENDLIGDYLPFKLFREAAIDCMVKVGIPEDHYRDNLLVMWATVHGLAAMANMKGFHFDGDWNELTGKILHEKINVN